MAEVALIDTVSDFETLEVDLLTLLTAEDVVKDTLQSSTGRIFVKVLAGTGAMLNYKIERALLESLTQTAYNKSSLWAISNFLGGAPRRKVGSIVQAHLTLDVIAVSEIIIPEHTLFRIEGVDYYNVEDIIIPIDAAGADFQLRQGTWKSVEFQPDGTPYQVYEYGSNFAVSDDEVKLFVNNVEWTRERYSISQYDGIDEVYLEITTPTGQNRIVFGNDRYGKIPIVGHTIRIEYTEVVGADSNMTLSGVPVKYEGPAIPGHKILTTSAILYGDDEEDSETLRYTSPRLFASTQRAVTRADYEVYILRFPSVASVRVWGEYEEAMDTGTQSNSMMNRAYASVVPKYVDTNLLQMGVGDGSTDIFYHTALENLPLIAGSVRVQSNTETLIDQKNGLLTSTLGGTGTINYETGAISTNFFLPPANGDTIMVSYSGAQFSAVNNAALLEYINERNHFTTQFIIRPSVATLTDLTAQVYYKSSFNPVTVKAAVEAAIRAHLGLFRLGGEYHQSDFIDLIMSVPGVDWVTLLVPNAAITLKRNEFLILNELTITMAKSARA